MDYMEDDCQIYCVLEAKVRLGSNNDNYSWSLLVLFNEEKVSQFRIIGQSVIYLYFFAIQCSVLQM